MIECHCPWSFSCFLSFKIFPLITLLIFLLQWFQRRIRRDGSEASVGKAGRLAANLSPSQVVPKPTCPQLNSLELVSVKIRVRVSVSIRNRGRVGFKIGVRFRVMA